jgi:alpha-glucosidase (family GH31 glycosyl hydrolase)
VVEPGVRDRRCYLPGIDAWTHVASGARFDGGQWVKVPALLGSPTWFSRYESR